MANVTVREMHVHHETYDEKKRIWKYRIEIWEIFMGRRRCLRKFPVHGNQLERIKRRFQAQFRVQHKNVITHPPEGDHDTGKAKEATTSAHGA